MSKRRKSNHFRSSRRRRVGRRAVVPPELLEQRNAPGACMYLSWLMDPPSNNLSESFILSAADQLSQDVEISQGKTRPLDSRVEDDAQAPAGQLDELSLLGNSEAASSVRSMLASHLNRAKSPTPSATANFAISEPVGEFVRGTVLTILPSVRAPVTKAHEPAEEPSAPLIVPPADAPTANTGSGGGGGSSNSAGGGPPAGGGRTAIQPQPPQSATATVAAAPNIVTAPPVVAAKSPVVISTESPPQPVTVTLQAANLIVPTLSVSAPNIPAPDANIEIPLIVNSQGSATQSSVAIAPVASPVPVVTAPVSSAAALYPASASLSALSLSGPIVTASDVESMLDRASAATSRNDAIIAIVDRSGRILGVRVESGVPIALNSPTMVFAIDGAVAKARTAAFFSNDAAPLTSRTVRFISQTTITQREVESNPNVSDPTKQGPGFVAPIGLGGHFPPGVQFTPHVDLFAIEHTNRDSLTHPGSDATRGNADDITLTSRFGADFAIGVDIPAPESYGVASGSLTTAQSRGIATLPGGVPLFKRDPDDMNKPKLVGGIGVFFPGPDGYATFEQNFQHTEARMAAGAKPQMTSERLNAPLVKQAEYMAFAAAGGVGTIAGIPLPGDYVLPMGRIDLAGITLEIYGPHPSGAAGLIAFGKKIGEGAAGGTDMPVTTGGDLYIDGQQVPDGWLVEPQASSDLTADEVRKIIEDGVAEAMRVRAAIRLPVGSRTQMVLSVTDTNGEILGLYRMPDATFFSIDVAVAKARNVAYYADAAALQPEDQIDDNGDGNADVPAGTALTNRTFRYLASPFFPTGVDTTSSGPFSILNDPGINPWTAENWGPALPADQYTSVLGYDAFNPGTNFHELSDSNAVAGNQNGVVFFPGSTPLYKNGKLVGGLGVSGDGVDQDDVVTFGAAGNFLPRPHSTILRADETFVRGVRLPYQKFSRNARA